jgi:hypothetical protein
MFSEISPDDLKLLKHSSTMEIKEEPRKKLSGKKLSYGIGTGGTGAVTHTSGISNGLVNSNKESR